jgi:hypothetical protein
MIRAAAPEGYQRSGDHTLHKGGLVAYGVFKHCSFFLIESGDNSGK